MSRTANTSNGLDKDEAGTRRERPWLLPSNRKLRHLQGISIRNLVITPPLSRPRGKTIDDEEIPNSLQSPSKLLAQSASRPLPQSRSFADLKTVPATSDSRDDAEQQPAWRLRRRSMLPWNDPNPQMRQIKLEDITKTRMADTWFSIHCDGIDTPVYVSEVVENATNPSFKAFDLNVCGPKVSRADCLTLKLWAKSTTMKEYVLLVELQLCLQSLQFLGKSLDSFHQPLPSNSILFHLTDGVYTNLTGIPSSNTLIPSAASKFSDGVVLPTSSYDALMRLANLDECIQDALATREKLESQISAILEQNHHAMTLTSDVSRAQDKLALTKHAVAAGKKQLRATWKRKEELIASIKARREAMERGRYSQEKARCHLPDAQQKLASCSQVLKQNTEETKGQIRRIAEDLLAIYPIEPIPDKPLAFTIAGLALPNSNFGDIDRDAVAAALGYTAHLVYLLSFYLSVPIPYPVYPYLSNSLIQDPVSASLPQRTYPLYPVNVQYRFEYGVFLLNKDIEFLKYLLYVLTAGTSEIPARKSGGIRGLLQGRLTPSLSRRGSEDSVGYTESIFPRKEVRPSSKLNGDLASDKAKQTSPHFPSTATSYQVT